MNQLLKTIDVTDGQKKNRELLDKVEANIHIIGVDSDLFFTAEENRETHKKLALTKENVTYYEINSVHGHDAFLMEYDQTENALREELTYPAIEIKNGMIEVPNRPGLGIDVDEAILAKYAIPKDKIKSIL